MNGDAQDRYTFITKVLLISSMPELSVIKRTNGVQFQAGMHIGLETKLMARML